MKSNQDSPFNLVASASAREVEAWVCLIITGFIYIPYFSWVWSRYAQGELEPGSLLGAFIGTIISYVGLVVVTHIVMAIVLKDEPKDERDVIIRNKSANLAYNVLSIATVLTAACMIVAGAMEVVPAVAQYLRPAFLSQVFLFYCILAEAVQYLTQIICYRRGS